MAKTIVEIQALIDAQNLDARQLINLIVDYLQANPPGGGGATPTLAQVLAESNIKVYKAILSQSGTDAPVATVLQNTIGAIVWTRNATGDYRATLTGAFPEDKVGITYPQIPVEEGLPHFSSFYRVDNNSLILYVSKLIVVGEGEVTFQQEDGIYESFIEITVYP